MKCSLGLVEVEPFCQDPRCRLKWTLRVLFLQECHEAGQAQSPQYNIALKMEQSKSSYSIWPHKGTFLCRITGLVIFGRSSSFPLCTSHSSFPSVKYQIRLNNQIFFNILVLFCSWKIHQAAARIFIFSPSSCHSWYLFSLLVVVTYMTEVKKVGGNVTSGRWSALDVLPCWHFPKKFQLC